MRFLDKIIDYNAARILSMIMQQFVAFSGMILTIIGIILVFINIRNMKKRSRILFFGSLFLLFICNVIVFNYSANERYTLQSVEMDGHIYFGQVINGLPDGWGKEFNQDKKICYVGSFEQGLYDGYGCKYKTVDGCAFAAYEGEFEQGKEKGRFVRRELVNGKKIVVCEGVYLNGIEYINTEEYYYEYDKEKGKVIRHIIKQEESKEEDKPKETDAKEPDTKKLFAEPDKLLKEGKKQIDSDTEVAAGMESLSSAIKLYVENAKEAGDVNLAAEKAADAYSSYVSAVIKHKNMLEVQALSGAIYGQIMQELEEAISIGNDLAARGYTVDVSVLNELQKEFKTAYTDKIICAFDEFASRAAWSRTEAWNLMSATAGNMFADSDLDDPIRLRYAYALSWWTQKQIETELASGMITKKGAAIKIANLIVVMDYNPMMLHYYITYMNEMGEDCSEVANAYNEIVQHLADTQGIKIGTDIDLAHFWYFNDFITHPVDSTNGVTQENRQWIREKMAGVEFVTK